jgi:cell division protein FtsB
MAAAPTRIRWDRVGRWALICVFALVIYLYIGPARTWMSTYAEAKRKREDVASLRAQNERLRERKQRLERTGAVELEARKLGMVKAGEKLYVIK